MLLLFASIIQCLHQRPRPLHLYGMKMYYLLICLMLVSCSAPTSVDPKGATLECLLDAFIAENAPDNDELLVVLEGTHWTDTTSIIVVSICKKAFLNQEMTGGKQEAVYRDYQVLYAADAVDGSERSIDSSRLIPHTIALKPFNTRGLPSESFMPPYDPPTAQVIYNHGKEQFEDALLLTSSLDLPSCGSH